MRSVDLLKDTVKGAECAAATSPFPIDRSQHLPASPSTALPDVFLLGWYTGEMADGYDGYMPHGSTSFVSHTWDGRYGFAGIGSRVGTVKPPVLVLWGRHDKILPPETALKFAEALPHATVTYLESSGHSGHLEEPGATASPILEFAAAAHQ